MVNNALEQRYVSLDPLVGRDYTHSCLRWVTAFSWPINSNDSPAIVAKRWSILGVPLNGLADRKDRRQKLNFAWSGSRWAEDILRIFAIGDSVDSRQKLDSEFV